MEWIYFKSKEHLLYLNSQHAVWSCSQSNSKCHDKNTILSKQNQPNNSWALISTSNRQNNKVQKEVNSAEFNFV